MRNFNDQSEPLSISHWTSWSLCMKPGSGLLTRPKRQITIQGTGLHEQSLHIYRLDGGVQYAQENLDNQTIHQISTASWKPGTYFVKVQNANGEIRTSLLSVVK
jgi:hypothetical protein